jgi:hypothetical protein
LTVAARDLQPDFELVFGGIGKARPPVSNRLSGEGGRGRVLQAIARKPQVTGSHSAEDGPAVDVAALVARVRAMNPAPDEPAVAEVADQFVRASPALHAA